MNTNDVVTSRSFVAPVKLHYNPCKIQRVLYGFIDMDVLCARIVLAPGEYSNIRSAYGSYYSCIRRLKVSVRVSIRKGEMFLFRTDKEANMREIHTSKYLEAVVH